MGAYVIPPFFLPWCERGLPIRCRCHADSAGRRFSRAVCRGRARPFSFPDETMIQILTSSQLRQLDAFSVQAQHISSLDLMERASDAFAQMFVKEFDNSRPVVVFAGPGNNGGDGLAVSRLLLAAGFGVAVYLFNTGNGLSEDCAAEKERLLEAVSPQLDFHEVVSQFVPPHIGKDTVVIDALFGTGLNRPLAGGFAAVVKYINASSATVVSVDVPSGLMTEDNTSNIAQNIIRAQHTITFQAPKLAFLFPENEVYVGRWSVADIGLSDPADMQRQSEGLPASPYTFVQKEDAPQWLKTRSRFAHKGTQGHGLLVAGHPGMAGAAVLAAKACMRGGVGKLSVLTQEENRVILQVAVPEALPVFAERMNFAALENEYDSFAVGPAIGTGEGAAQLLDALLPGLSVPVVLDADALTLLANNPAFLDAVPRDSILTPHKGELAHLIGHQRNSYEELQNVRDFARDRRLNVLIKGAYSASVLSDGSAWFNSSGNSGMATAGAGDVLTGLLLALLAQGYAPADALRLGVYLHGLAGDLAAADGAPESLIASDLIAFLPRAFRSLRSGQ